MIDAAHLPPAGSLVVAVSGGADSLALWDLLADLDRWHLHIWHLDHGIRPADADLVCVHDLAERHQREGRRAAVLMVEREDVPTRARDWGIGLEEAGRRLRYAGLARLAAQVAAPAVLTAHHRDDQVETILMNLLRGAADTGVMGIRPWRDLAPGCRLVRPLLAVPRQELRDHCQRRRISWAEDPTNTDPRWRRNEIRRSILPTFESGAPGFSAVLLARAAAARERWSLAETAVDAAWTLNTQGELVLAPLLALEASQRSHAWRRLLALWEVHPDRGRIAAVEDLAQGRPGRRYRIGRWLARRRGRTLAWTPVNQ